MSDPTGHFDGASPAPTPDDSGPAQRKPLVFPSRERVGVPLPASLTTFVGREREVPEVAALLLRPRVRLVTLTGPGVAKGDPGEPQVEAGAPMRGS